MDCCDGAGLGVTKESPTGDAKHFSERPGYAEDDKRIMSAIARHVIGLVEAEQTSNVVVLR